MNQIEQWTEGRKTAVITGHVRPDGDCAGACLGLASYLRDNAPQLAVDVYLEPFSESFGFLRGAGEVIHACDAPKTYDLAFALDAGDFGRLGEAGRYVSSAALRVCLDHHITNIPYGDVNIVRPEVSSTCELLYSLMDPEKISRETAECLYLGIVHDTGVFRHTNTTEQTMCAAGRLLSLGVRSDRIIDDTFYKKTFAQNKILGTALDSARLWLDGRMITGVIFQADLARWGLSKSDLDGIVDQLRVTDGVEAAVFLSESDPEKQEFRVSMRVNGDRLDVSRIAAAQGGGGHVKAAGCTMYGNWTEIARSIADQVRQQLG